MIQLNYNRRLSKTTYFVSNFVIENNVPMYSLYDEGRILYDKGLTISSVEVNMKDHLGNVRAVFDITTGQVKQTNTYYPFGMQNSSLSANTTTTKNFNEYKYNGKMFQDENGLNWYDYGARFYDAVVGRWWSVDPLSEKHTEWSPYAYCINNPILRFDPLGLTDYTINKRTGMVNQVGEKNNQPDRVLKTNRRGEVKINKKGNAIVAIDGIQQGILKDGQNYKEKSQLIDVGGEGQPTVKDVESFALKFSRYLGKEIGGSYFTKEGSISTTHMAIGNYKNNTFKSTSSTGHVEGFRNGLNPNELKGFFHTHPSSGYSFEERTRPSPKDIDSRNLNLQDNPDLKFFIITAPLNYGEENIKIEYTK